MSWKSARKREMEREAQREFDHYNSGKGSWVREELEKGETPANSGERAESLVSHEHGSGERKECDASPSPNILKSELVEALESCVKRMDLLRELLAISGANDFQVLKAESIRAAEKLIRIIRDH